jgi:subtilisin-like proprotein convertase family protein
MSDVRCLSASDRPATTTRVRLFVERLEDRALMDHGLVGSALECPAADVPIPTVSFPPAFSSLYVAEDLTVGDIDVRLHISHTWVDELRLSLFSPSGTRVILSQFRGGIGYNYENTVFDDEASVPVGEGVAPFAGSYQPETPLSALDGENAWGTWQLWVEDGGPFADGVLNSWSLIIADPPRDAAGGQASSAGGSFVPVDLWPPFDLLGTDGTLPSDLEAGTLPIRAESGEPSVDARALAFATQEREEYAAWLLGSEALAPETNDEWLLPPWETDPSQDR